MIKQKQIIISNIILSILLILCLFDLPYGYYQLVRFAAAVVFIINGFYFYSLNNIFYSILSFAFALLFQPIIKVALGRSIWGVVDVIVAIWLIYLAWALNKGKISGV